MLKKSKAVVKTVQVQICPFSWWLSTEATYLQMIKMTMIMIEVDLDNTYRPGFLESRPVEYRDKAENGHLGPATGNL